MHNINDYVGRQSAWHSLGQVLGRAFTAQEIMSRPKFNYQVEKRQLSLDGKLIDAWGTVRTDNGEFLSTVGRDYTVIPHAIGFGMTDALVASTDGAHYETAGVLGKGETVWGLANLNTTLSVGDDKSTVYLLFSTSYDGSHSHSYRTTSVRVVCQNTLTLALSGKTDSQLRFRHTRNARVRIEDAHKALATLTSDVKTAEQKLNFLATRKVTRESVTELFDKLFPKTKNDDGVERSSPRRDNVLASILANYERNDGDAFPEQRGTSYNLLNAITEFVDHERPGVSNRAQSALFGSGEVLKNKALDLIIEQANGLPQVVARRTMVFAPDAQTSRLMTETVSSPAPIPSTSLLEAITEEQATPAPQAAPATISASVAVVEPPVAGLGDVVRIVGGVPQRLLGATGFLVAKEGARIKVRTSIAGVICLHANDVRVEIA